MDQLSINTSLVRIAYDSSEAFCYGCYIKVSRAGDDPTRCPRCGRDDLMSICDGEGPEWGVAHITERLLADNCEKISECDLTERFQGMLDECSKKSKYAG